MEEPFGSSAGRESICRMEKTGAAHGLENGALHGISSGVPNVTLGGQEAASVAEVASAAHDLTITSDRTQGQP
ncbi:hypothetical protein ASPCADRAFT_204860 [Aspergillus carbonarius ITEM 5010]|uniref:Uncharacterized protein n=1 Tax=Aspergillus carbonarius (strain ITEM 5010) TaxID=602072 RepID=A0A1R3RXG3_ASPC5|nr:hypothetical protein ASPCADRAFT_204860 [Aspergillus carbonarius ITEM 5010]